MPSSLTLSIIRYGSRVKRSNPGKGVAPSPHLAVVAMEKGDLGSPSTTVANLTFILLVIRKEKGNFFFHLWIEHIFSWEK